MDYKNLVKDFAERTEHNLNVIEEINAIEKQAAYEVTQLINSLLGLLILPQQKFFDSIPKDSIEKARKDGWNIPEPLDDKLQQVDDLSVFLRYLRNGVSHFNIKFLSSDEQISGIEIWNILPHSKSINWKIKLDIHEIKSITTKIKGLVNDFE